MRVKFDREIGKCPVCGGEQISWQVTNHYTGGVIIDLRCMNFDCGHGWRFKENDKEIVSEQEEIKYDNKF